MIKKVFNKKNFWILLAIFVFCLFAYITYCTPLAGDDWDFAVNTRQYSPIEQAFKLYSSFSGRFFSELWENFGASHKWFWNILNPTLFTIIFAGIIKLSHIEKKHILIPLVILSIMLSVDDNLRMETYSWMTGEIYVIPLALSIVYFLIIDELFYDNSTVLKKSTKIKLVLSNILCFYIGLTLENIAAVMIVGIGMIIVYAYFNKRRAVKYLIPNFILLLIAFVIMRSSPGSYARLIRDHYEWSQLNLLNKISDGYPNFLQFTFISNNYMMLFFGGTISTLALFSKQKVSIWFRVLIIALSIISVFAVFSFVLPWENNFLIDSKSLFSFIFWPIYIIFVTIALFKLLDGKRREKALFFFVLAGGANIAMIFSPIFGSRSSIYTVYFIIVVVAIILDSINLPKIITICIFAICGYVLCVRTAEFINKYTAVKGFQEERESIVKYYVDNPQIEEVWIPRFPDYSIHGIDVNPGDSYHLKVFKKYYNLPQDADKITFYYKEGQ